MAFFNFFQWKCQVKIIQNWLLVDSVEGRLCYPLWKVWLEDYRSFWPTYLSALPNLMKAGGRIYFWNVDCLDCIEEHLGVMNFTYCWPSLVFLCQHRSYIFDSSDCAFLFRWPSNLSFYTFMMGHFATWHRPISWHLRQWFDEITKTSLILMVHLLGARTSITVCKWYPWIFSTSQ